MNLVFFTEEKKNEFVSMATELFQANCCNALKLAITDSVFETERQV